MAKAGLKAIYLSGWQVAADGNLAADVYPDQSLYPGEQRPGDGAAAEQRAPARRPDRVGRGQGGGIDYLLPIVADAEAGFGGPLNAFELMKGMIEAGAAAVHFEDQLSSEKKCGHLGGKVLVPTGQFIRTLLAARLAADMMGVPTLVVARTDADAATLLTSDADERDHEFLTGERTPEGFYYVRARHRGGDRTRPRVRAVRRPRLDGDLDARSRRGARVRRGDPRRVPRQAARLQLLALLQLAAAPRRRRRSSASSASSGRWATSSSSSRSRASTRSTSRCSSSRAATRPRGCPPTCGCRSASSRSRPTATRRRKHQREVGAGWFDEIAQAVSGGRSSTLALKGSTEEAQFDGNGVAAH